MVENKSLHTFMVISLLMHALLFYLTPWFGQIEHEERIGSYIQAQLIQSSLSPVPTKRPGTRPRHQARKPIPAQHQAKKANPVQQQAQKPSPAQPQVQKAVPAQHQAQKAISAQPQVHKADPAQQQAQKPSPAQPQVHKAIPAQQQAQKAIPVPEMDSKVLDRMKTVRDVPMPSFDLPRPQQREIQPVSDAALKDDFLDHDLGDEVAAQQKRSSPVVQTPPPQPRPRDVSTNSQEQENPPEPEEIDFDQESPEEKITQAGDPSLTSDIEWQGKPRRIVRRPDHPPRYPDGYQGQTQGRISLKFWVDSQGYVIRVIPMQKLDPRLDAVATDYLRQYRFEPTISPSRGAVLEWGIIPFTFHLK